MKLKGERILLVCMFNHNPSQNNPSISQGISQLQSKKQEITIPMQISKTCIRIRVLKAPYSYPQPFQNPYPNPYPSGCGFYISKFTLFADADADIHGLSASFAPLAAIFSSLTCCICQFFACQHGTESSKIKLNLIPIASIELWR